MPGKIIIMQRTAELAYALASENNDPVLIEMITDFNEGERVQLENEEYYSIKNQEL